MRALSDALVQDGGGGREDGNHSPPVTRAT